MSPCNRDITLAVEVDGVARPNLLFPFWGKRTRVAFTRKIRANIQTLGKAAA